MSYVADLHIHSRFSRACSANLNIPNLAEWGRLKGIDLMGTGDCLHPIWQKELQVNLKDIGAGTYQFGETKFILTTEVACIYSEAGKSHRTHLLIFLPSLDSVFKLSEVLTKKHLNLSSDGRPIFGLSAKALSEIVFSVEPKALIIPAHIWTPWFSLFGSESGYDLLTDCFGQFSEQIYGIETGLSSEPAMNWRVSQLDQKSILSFSDAHSLPRLGREATLIAGDCSYDGLYQAIKNQQILGTIEFFPEEGKYHYTGQRNCGVVYKPEQLKAKGEICPVCGRRLTIGVVQRVEDLATRKINDLRLQINDGITQSEAFPNRAGFRMLVQLEEIIAASLKSTVASQKVKELYNKLVTQLDSELKILTKTKIELIALAAGERVAEGVERVRQGKLSIEPGFDNTYGKVQIFSEEEEQLEKSKTEQMGLF